MGVSSLSLRVRTGALAAGQQATRNRSRPAGIARLHVREHGLWRNARNTLPDRKCIVKKQVNNECSIVVAVHAGPFGSCASPSPLSAQSICEVSS